MAVVAIAGATAVREVVTDDAPEPVDTRVERVGSEPLPAGEPIDGGLVAPETWRVRYLVTGPGSRSTETVTVRAPFDSHTDVRVGDELREQRETALGVSATKPENAAPVVLSVAPEPAGLRPGPSAEDAVSNALAERRERREVADRACRVYRTSAASGGATFAPGWTPTDHVDLCIDETTGLLLELVEVFEGRIIRQRVALDVDLSLDVSEDVLARLPHERTIPAARGGGSIRPVDSATQPVGPFLAIDAPPVGYELLGRFEVIPPQPDLARPENRGRVVAATSDVFVRGPEAIVVERGARLDRSNPWEASDAFPDVDLGAAGTGEFLAGLNGAEVRALLGDGRFLRVYGTVGLDELLVVARALRPTDGGTGPDYLDD